MRAPARPRAAALLLSLVSASGMLTLRPSSATALVTSDAASGSSPASPSEPEPSLRSRPWEVSLGVMMLLGFPGPGSAFGPSLRVSRTITPRTALGLLIAGPLSNRQHDLPNGDRWTARQELAALDLSFRLPLSRHTQIAVAAGGGVYHVNLRAQSAFGPVQHASSFSWLANASARFDLRLRADLALYTDVRVAVVTPVPVLQFTGRRVATAGDPALGVSFGIALTF